MTKLHFIPIGNTGKICIKEDNATTPRCLESGRLDWDDNMRTIPEIQRLSVSDVVVDAGAFIGDSTRIFLNRGSAVYAFEPDVAAFTCLSYNCPEAHCYNVALGNGEPYRVPVKGGNVGGKWIVPDAQSPLNAIKLDSLCLPRLTFLKVDVEGFEVSVLAGAEETIRRCRPILLIEFNPHAQEFFGTSAELLEQRILSLGYQRSRNVFRYGEENWDVIYDFTRD